MSLSGVRLWNQTDGLAVVLDAAVKVLVAVNARYGGGADVVFPVATFERLVNDPASGQAMLAEAATASAVATAMAASATEGASDGRAGIAAEFVAAPLGGQSLADAPPDGQTSAAAADSQRYDNLAGRWGNCLRILMMCAWSAVPFGPP